MAPNVLLSAAHCAGLRPTHVMLGLHKITQDLGVEFSNIEHIPIAQTTAHPNYNSQTSDNDFLMIRLQCGGISWGYQGWRSPPWLPRRSRPPKKSSEGRKKDEKAASAVDGMAAWRR